MGGRCIESSRRVPRDVYDEVLKEVSEFLKETFSSKVLEVPFYRSKPDFGDLDVVVNIESLLSENAPDRFEVLKHALKSRFHSRQVSVNDNIVSFEYRSAPSEEHGFQVDLLAFPEKEMNVAQTYFSYNDLGNLMGRVAHKMGLVYGHRGLLYLVRENTHLLETLVVSQDTSRIFEFLGFDKKRFEEGFETLEDIFMYAKSTPYFNAEMYALENRNHRDRTRDRKRSTYRSFLESLNGEVSSYPFPEDKSVWLPKIDEAFPGFKEQRLAVLNRHEMKKKLKLLFNGHLVGEATGLQGVELSQCMSSIQKQYPTLEVMLSYLENHKDAFYENLKQQYKAKTFRP